MKPAARSCVRVVLAGLALALAATLASADTGAQEAAIVQQPVALAMTAAALAPGVYLFEGRTEAVSPANRGVVANTGFIVGSTGVLVINTGASHRIGEAMLAAIARVTPLPVKLVVITQQAPEIVFGASAFRDRGIPIFAHRKTAALIEERCAICLKKLVATLGTEEMRNSRVTVPDTLLDGSTQIDVIGRAVDLAFLGWASTPGDLAVFDRESGVMFTGGLVTRGRIPELRNENLDGWLDALKALESWPVRQLVPGFGPVGTLPDAAPLAGYLRGLRDATRGALERGASLTEAMREVQVPAYRSWALYDTAHAQNVQRIYVGMENAAASQKADAATR
jgi:glyoxylase-like metal-dependent hydrolase (beta-lactamase superfamily II)